MAEIPSKDSIENLSSMIEMITGKKLTDVLSKAGTLADCSGHCGCHSRFCSCHGSVSSITAGQELINPDDFVEIRDAQINDLKKKLDLLTKPMK